MTDEQTTTETEGWRRGAASAMDRVNRLTAAQRQLHHALLRAFPRFGGPPPGAWLAEQAARVGLAPSSALAGLAAKDVIQLNPQTGAIVAAYPYSGVPTAHRVQVAGGEPVYSMCAIDALGIPFMLGMDATVTSTDPITGDTIRIIVDGVQATWEPPSACMVAGCVEGDGPISTTLCPMVNFFASPTSADAYRAAHPEVDGHVLDQAAAVRSGQRTFGTMLTALDGQACTAVCCDGGTWGGPAASSAITPVNIRRVGRS